MLTDQQRLQQLLDNTSWTPADKEWLLSYLENTASATAPTELETLMARLYEKDLSASDPLEENISILMRQHIAARTGIDMDRRRIGRYIRWWSAAAAIIIFLAGGIWIYRAGMSHSTIAAKLSPNKDIAPGGNKAILTTSDGRRIVLDSAATGELALEGTTKVIKLDSGLLSYSLVEPAHTTGASHANNDASSQADYTPLAYNTITTPRGGQYQVVLPDGTKVWLNAASSLKFPTAFTGRERTVELKGEAYFEVASRYYPAGTAGPDRIKKKIPFIVQVPPAAGGTDPMKVEVLGTHFNVNAYGDEPTAKTTLLEGSIRISKGANTHLLTPGQQAVLDNTNSRILVSNGADLDEAVAWKNGLFIFNSLPLESIMRQMERWYDVEVSYDGNIKNISFNGQISRYSNASQMLDMLATTGEVHFKMENKKITVRP